MQTPVQSPQPTHFAGSNARRREERAHGADRVAEETPPPRNEQEEERERARRHRKPREAAQDNLAPEEDDRAIRPEKIREQVVRPLGDGLEERGGDAPEDAVGIEKPRERDAPHRDERGADEERARPNPRAVGPERETPPPARMRETAKDILQDAKRTRHRAVHAPEDERDDEPDRERHARAPQEGGAELDLLKEAEASAEAEEEERDEREDDRRHADAHPFERPLHRTTPPFCT